jgi:hypothetical protein
MDDLKVPHADLIEISARRTDNPLGFEGQGIL